MFEARESIEGTSRFGALKPWPARLVLLLCLLLVAIGLAGAPAPVPANTGKAEADHADVRLYERVTAGVRSGGDYYEVAAAAHRAGDYPLRPFFTVRPPTLASFHAALGSRTAAEFALGLLIATAAFAWLLRLRREGFSTPRALIGTLLLLSGMAVFKRPELLYWHEAWAAPLIALSLALSGRRYWPSVLLGLAAALVRDIAILYAAAMLGAAFLARRRGEAAAWAGAILLFALFMAWHAQQVAAVSLPQDAASPGWADAGGWSFVVTMTQLTGPARALPYWLTALALPLALLGWAGWRTRLGGSVALLLAGYAAMFACVGRPDNYYWAFLIAPLVPLGLFFAPTAVADLVRAAKRPTSPAEAPLST